MFRRFSVNFALLSMAIDAAFIVISLAVSTWLRPFLAFLPFAAHYPEYVATPWVLYPIFASEWIAIMLLFSVYDGRKNLREVDEFTSLTLASALATVAMAGTLYLTYRDVSRLLYLLYVLMAYSFMLGWRLIARLAFKYGDGRFESKRRVLIVGTGLVGRQLKDQIDQNSQLGLKFVGFLDDNLQKSDQNPDILAGLTAIQPVVVVSKVDDVVIALPQRAYEQTNQLVGELHRLPVKVWVIPDYFRLALHKAAVEEFAGIPMLDLRAPALNDYQRMVKRAFDLLVVLLLMPVALPLFGLIALAVRFERPGPVIFRQPRSGENGRVFDMFKFRTMVDEAENLRHLVERIDEDGQTIHKTLEDPRVTKVGRILRRTSLDELPQLVNVLKGEMSLVGPRPELPYLVAEYELWQRQRFAVPQGITGWWQIHGRSDRPMHLNTEDDLYYVQNYSLLLDLYILFKTVPVVIRGQGAF